MSNLVRTIVDNEATYMTIHEKRELIVSRLKGKNVQFSDVETYLLKEARREKFYTADEHLVSAREDKKEWIVCLDRYIKWISTTYKAKWELRELPAKKKNVILPGKPQVHVVQKVVTEKRVDKMLENPENVKQLEAAMIKKGKIVIDVSITPEQAERLIEDDTSLEAIIIALEAEGFTVGRIED